MADHLIDAEHVRLALVARKIAQKQRQDGRGAEAARWAAMSAHTQVLARCRIRRGSVPPATVKHPSTLMPMNRGFLHSVIERMRLTQGLPSIRKTFGCGLRAILAETHSSIMR